MKPDSRDVAHQALSLELAQDLVDLFGKRAAQAHAQHLRGGTNSEFYRGISVAYGMARDALLRS